jgi:hypothetical protein
MVEEQIDQLTIPRAPGCNPAPSRVKKKIRAIAQAVSSLFPTAAARIRSQVRLCGICGGQSGTGAGLLRVFRFPLPIPPTAPSTLYSVYTDSVVKQLTNKY